jgi:hypothetical protein
MAGVISKFLHRQADKLGLPGPAFERGLYSLAFAAYFFKVIVTSYVNILMLLPHAFS